MKTQTGVPPGSPISRLYEVGYRLWNGRQYVEVNTERTLSEDAVASCWYTVQLVRRELSA
jgi:hypothetical protein